MEPKGQWKDSIPRFSSHALFLKKRSMQGTSSIVLPNDIFLLACLHEFIYFVVFSVGTRFLFGGEKKMLWLSLGFAFYQLQTRTRPNGSAAFGC